MPRGLIWCGGDVTQYVPVSYHIENERVNTFFVPAALNAVFNYDKLAALIPKTLFTSDHGMSYELLLKAKSGYPPYTMEKTVNDPHVKELVRKGFTRFIVPHPGIAAPLSLTIEDSEGEKKVRVRRTKSIEFTCSFNRVLNFIYRHLIEFTENSDIDEVHLDLTHGTNVLVNALMIAGTILHMSRDVEVKFWSAPILGRPQPSQEVEILDITDAVKAMTEVVSGTVAWRLVDERILPVGYLKEMGRELGPKYRHVFGNVQSIASKASSILWGIRSGQAVILRKQLEQLAQVVSNAKESLRELLNREFSPDISQENEGACVEPPWVLVADVVIERTRRLLDRITEEAIDMESSHLSNLKLVRRFLRLYKEVELYDKILSLGREWLVLLLVRRLLKGSEVKRIKIGEGEWRRIDDIIAKWTSASRLDLEESALLSKLGLKTEDRDVLTHVRMYRNMLMHGRLSREEDLYLDIESGEISKKDLKTNIIKKETLKKVSEKLLELINRLT